MKGVGGNAGRRVRSRWRMVLWRCVCDYAPTCLPAYPLGLAVLFLALGPQLAYSQDERCTFQIDNVDRQASVKETTTGTNYFAGGNVRLSCRGQQLTMQSDSVAAYGGNVVQFIGKVKYRDSTITMDADQGTYYRNGEERAA